MSSKPPDLGTTFGALYLGCIVSTALYGFTSNQAFVYFKKYHATDTWKIRSLVITLWLLDSFQVALMVDITWSYLVAGYSNPGAITILVWSFSLELAITVVVTFLVRSFYMMQLWGLSRKILIIGPALLFASGQLVLGLETSAHMFRDPSILTVTNKTFVWILGSKCVCSVLADILITAATCYYLHAARTGFTRTNILINLLSVYTINRGVLAMLWETFVMITFLTMQKNFIFAALHLMLGKLHTASLLALLNNRDTLRRRQTAEPGTFSHVEMNRSTSRSMHDPHTPRNVEVEVMVTSETVVENENLSLGRDRMKPKKESFPYAAKSIVW